MVALVKSRPLLAANLMTVTLLAALSAPAALAAPPLNGLTVAVTQGGDRLVAAGDTRTIIELDPSTLEVQGRHWIGTTIVRMAFNRDGSTLAAQDTSNTVHLYDPTTWKARTSLPNRDLMTAAPAADLLAGVEMSHRRGFIHFNSLSDGADRGQIAIAARERIAAIGFSRDAARLGVVLQATAAPEEQKISPRDIPEGLRGLARSEFMQRHDGRGSTMRVYDVATGAILAEARTFFSLGGRGVVGFDGQDMIVVGTSRVAAQLAPNGEAQLFEMKNRANYAIALSPDHRMWMTGGMANYALTGNPDLVTRGYGRLDKLPGWPEYFKGFSATMDNQTIYAATSAYRIVKIGGDGAIELIAPVR